MSATQERSELDAAPDIEVIRHAVGELEDPIRRIGRAAEALYRVGESLHDGKDREAVVALYEHLEATHKKVQAAFDAAFDAAMGHSPSPRGPEIEERADVA